MNDKYLYMFLCLVAGILIGHWWAYEQRQDANHWSEKELVNLEESLEDTSKKFFIWAGKYKFHAIGPHQYLVRYNPCLKCHNRVIA